MKWSEYRHLVGSDLYRYCGGNTPAGFLKAFTGIAGFRYTFFMRTSRFLKQKGPLGFPLYLFFRLVLTHYTYKFGISIPYNTEVGPGLYIGHFGGIFVNCDTKIGANCNINHDVTVGAAYGGKFPGCPVIGDNVYLGPGSKVIGGISLGAHVAVGANCVVTKPVPDQGVVVGIPGVVISDKGSAEYICNAIPTVGGRGMDKIRIAYLIDSISSDKAGTEKQLLQLMSRIDRERFEVTLICLHSSPWLETHELPYRVYDIGYRGLLSVRLPVAIARFLRLINDLKIDIVQSFFEDSMIFASMARLPWKSRYRLIVSRRDLGLGADEPRYHTIFKKLHPRIFSSADGIVVNASAIKESLVAKGVTPGKVSLIRNGMAIPVAPRDKPAVFNEDEKDVWVIIVANLKPVKRLDLFLKALSEAAATAPQLRIGGIVLGEGKLRQELETLSCELGIKDCVHFLGAVDNVTDYLHFCDIGVLCSDNEGLSNAVLEYMGCGLPVVVTAVGGNVELVDEANGFAVPAGDHQALASALSALIDDPVLRKDKGAASLARVRTVTGWGPVMSQWEEYYHRVMKEGADA